MRRPMEGVVFVVEVTADDRIRTFLTVMPRLLRPERPPVAALRDVADVARALFDARYGGAALLQDDGTFSAVSFSGLPPSAAEAIGADPARLFDAVDGTRAVRVEDFTSLAVPMQNLPEGHPPVRQLLAATLRSQDKVVGVI